MPTGGTRFFRKKTTSFSALVIAFVTVLSGCQSDQDQPQQSANKLQLAGKGIAVYAAGDIADCQKHVPAQTGAAATAALIASHLAADPDAAVLTLGDHTYPIGLLSEFTGCYEPTWGKFKGRTFPAPGNHEYYTPQADGYFRYFGDAGRHGYYSFQLGSWHIISLNSNLRKEDHRAQLAWLKKDLDNNKAGCTLAYWHHPLYSSGARGGNRNMQDVWAMLHAANVDVVLASHDHHYERFAPQDLEGDVDKRHGIRQFIVGTGGAELGTLGFRRKNSEASDNSTHGVLKLVLKKTGYEWEFLPIAENGFSDRGTALCH